MCAVIAKHCGTRVSESPSVLCLPLFAENRRRCRPNTDHIFAVIIFFSGYILVIFTRLICKIVLRNLLGSLIRLMDLECFELQKIKYDFSARYYSGSFKLPPVFSTKVGIEFGGHGKTKSCYQTSLYKDEIITAKNSLQ